MSYELEFQTKVLEGLARLETNMTRILGNGQPGMLTLQGDRITLLELAQAQAAGERKGISRISIGLSSVISTIITVGGLCARYFWHK